MSRGEFDLENITKDDMIVLAEHIEAYLMVLEELMVIPEEIMEKSKNIHEAIKEVRKLCKKLKKGNMDVFKDIDDWNSII